MAIPADSVFYAERLKSVKASRTERPADMFALAADLDTKIQQWQRIRDAIAEKLQDRGIQLGFANVEIAYQQAETELAALRGFREDLRAEIGW